LIYQNKIFPKNGLFLKGAYLIEKPERLLVFGFSLQLLHEKQAKDLRPIDLSHNNRRKTR
jgi:hypothetical protein